MRRILYLLLVIVLLSGVAGSALAAENWGLSFPSPGDKPVGNASAEALLEHGAYFIDPTEEKVIYLTFDAGFENGYTEPILDVLRDAEVPAAFFLVGTYIRDHPELVRRMVAEGHIVANHTMNHPNMAGISDIGRFRAELEAAEEAFETATGEAMPKFYRPPEGKYSEANLKMAKELGYTTVFWSLTYVDWYVDDQPSKVQAFEKLIPRMHPGAILMLHSTSATNAEILEELILVYREAGYEFRCLSELGRTCASKELIAP
ncbi:MAG: polysaccharide deacetylase family protein [Oscillospiraceae bacterium]|nr:polysaccharide deacetylase family protein [Oscillospiraceae bacterium]